ncbi:retrovirus-related pol polyprotein [Moniliophthora roreri MCA 2997]|uniref:Retrovirus-related pol polyprotein n=1 Tax=Moniliophthora roreri (strain MCA 2997) TaxID=1381753 RepID=V2WPC8_MONRO|nr:retrovirus-related pol polyprotein [Moniliophthora roreri MCA 2997]
MPRPPNTPTVTLKWHYTLRKDGEGRITERQARLVVRGFTQVKEVHYEDTWAMVARYESLRFVIAIAAYYGLNLWSGDFTTAYLNAKPQGVNYLNLPPGYESQYDLRDRAEMTTELGNTITVTYTDDVIGVSDTEEAKEVSVKEIGAAYDFRFYGEPDVTLGITIRRNPETGDVSIHQCPLIEKVIEGHGLQNAMPKFTPLPSNLTLIDSQPIPIPLEDSDYMWSKDYRRLIGSLNYISQGTRPNILYAVTLLQRYANDPQPMHWNAAIHVVTYLKSTISYQLTYQCHQGREDLLKPDGYADVSHADIQEENGEPTRKSTMGYVFKVAGGVVSWCSAKQRVVALLTTGAEYIAMVNAGKQAIWMWKFLDGVGHHHEYPFAIKVNNTSAIALSDEMTKHRQMKHFDTNWLWLQDMVHAKELKFNYVPSSDNLADLFTKQLTQSKTEQFSLEIGLRDN